MPMSSPYAKNCRLVVRALVRSIPIVSKLDFTHPVVGTKSNTTCGDGDIAWNTVAASPFAQQVSVNDWLELPDLLDRLQREPDEYINKLQVPPLRPDQKQVRSRRKYDTWGYRNTGIQRRVWDAWTLWRIRRRWCGRTQTFRPR